MLAFDIHFGHVDVSFDHRHIRVTEDETEGKRITTVQEVENCPGMSEKVRPDSLMLQTGIPRIFLQAFSPSVGFDRGAVVVKKELIPAKIIGFCDIFQKKLFRFVRNGDGSTTFYFRILGIKPDRSAPYI